MTDPIKAPLTELLREVDGARECVLINRVFGDTIVRCDHLRTEIEYTFREVLPYDRALREIVEEFCHRMERSIERCRYYTQMKGLDPDSECSHCEHLKIGFEKAAEIAQRALLASKALEGK